MRPCLVYGYPELTERTRCALYDRQQDRRRGTPTERGYTAAYQRARRELLAAVTVCAWCGRPGRPGDPLTADHLVPLAHGGGTEGNLVAAHRSGNSRRGGGTRRRW